MRYYKVIFDVDTDEDWSFMGEDAGEEYFKDIEIATNTLKERLKILRNTNTMPDSYKTSINQKIDDILLHIDNIFEEIGWACFRVEFYHGNYDGFFGIIPVEITSDKNKFVIQKLYDEDIYNLR